VSFLGHHHGRLISNCCIICRRERGRSGAPLLFGRVEKQRISRLHTPALRLPSQG
jgi:hypothetical protein